MFARERDIAQEFKRSKKLFSFNPDLGKRRKESNEKFCKNS